MSANLRIVPLGGLGEVGKNMISVGYGRNVLVIELGMMFPEAATLGVDFMLPD
jgi:ribonuclease J